MSSTAKQPWPDDAVMIVAAVAGEALVDRMRGKPMHAECRHCGAALLADSMTYQFAMAMPIRGERPVRFFCVACHELYELNQCEQIVDHRGERPRVIRGNYRGWCNDGR